MKWIKVSDQLPQLDQTVLAYGCKDGYPDEGCIMQCTYIFDIYSTPNSYKWIYGYGCCSDDFDLTNVTHWMLMPDKPNE